MGETPSKALTLEEVCIIWPGIHVKWKLAKGLETSGSTWQDLFSLTERKDPNYLWDMA